MKGETKNRVGVPGRRVGLALISAFILLPTAFLSAATNLYLINGASKLTAPGGWTYAPFRATAGSAINTATQNSKAGPITGQYFPCVDVFTNLTPAKLLFVSYPLSSAVTISGTITPNFWGKESNTNCNCGFRYEVLRWSVTEGGIVSSLGISTDNGATEWGTSSAVRTAPTLTPSSTSFATGDRIVLVIYNDDASGVTQGSGRTWTLDYSAGTAGSDGDTYVTFTETISLSGSDSNNARPIPAFSLLRPLLDWWREYFEEVLA